VIAATAATGTHNHAFIAVFGFFLLLSVTLAFFIVRFAVKLSRDRPGRTPRRPGRQP
jgi:hypothetical protein